MGLLDDLILDAPRHPPQLVGPQAGTVLRIEAARLVVSLEQFPAQEFACTWAAPAAHSHTDPDGLTGDYVPPSPVGRRCLVLFAGQGIADPWVVTVA